MIKKKNLYIYIPKTLILKDGDDFDSYNLSCKFWLSTSVVLPLMSFCLFKLQFLLACQSVLRV